MRALREDSDLRQKDIAAILHVCQHTYSDYETGKTRLPKDRMILLAEYYNVDLNYICGLTEEKGSFPK
jgi:transcriptional regulator with XRE-family HTH domain